MASQKDFILSDDERAFIENLRMQRTSSSAREQSPSPTKEQRSLEALPSPLSFSQRARDPQLVERRPLKRGAQSLALRITEAAVEEPQSKKPKKDKGKAIMTEKDLCSDPLRFTKRRIVNPLVVGEEFWLQHLSEDDNSRFGHGIQQFQSLLQLQGWDRLITEPFAVNDDAVRLFYAGMSFVSSKENSPASDIIVNWEEIGRASCRERV